MTNRRVLLLGSAATAVASAPPLPAIAAVEAIKFDTVQPSSGGLELFGSQAKIGVELAKQEINAAGSIRCTRHRRIDTIRAT